MHAVLVHGLPKQVSMRTLATRLSLTAVTLLMATTMARCSSAPEKPNVETELQKLKIPTIPKALTAAQKANIEQAWDGPGKWFVRRGCMACHAISVYGVNGLTPLGPDLSIAVDDVRTRFGRSVEEFLEKPQGTMEMVLGQLIKLTPDEKAEALRELHAAHQAHQKKKNGTE